MTTELAEKIVKFIADNTVMQSRLLYPNPQPLMHNPHGLLDLLRDEAGLAPREIDRWLCEAQGIEQEKE